MPDLLSVFDRWRKFILIVTFLAVIIAFAAALLSPKEFASVATALPANSVMADKARIFNSNIEELYSDFGSPDELDRMEGTALLDTLFIATANEFKLAEHYGIKTADEAYYKAAKKLKKNSDITKSAYGELKVKIWDKDKYLAATLANSLLQKLQELHQHLQNANNVLILKKINEQYLAKQQEYKQLNDTVSQLPKNEAAFIATQNNALLVQLLEYKKLIDEYELTLATNPRVLLVVELARPSIVPDRPQILRTVLFTLFAAFTFSFLISLFLESRKIRQ